jgi:RNA polymerase II-associated protein 2
MWRGGVDFSSRWMCLACYKHPRLLPSFRQGEISVIKSAGSDTKPAMCLVAGAMASSPSPKPLKSILKKPKSAPPAEVAPPSPAADLDFQRIALQHARILQQHKDLEARVFEAVNTLLDYPLQPPDTSSPAADPSPTDAETFRQLIRIFQPTDYDDLTEERNIAGKCGYALCPNARRTLPEAGEFKLRNAGRKNFDIVRTKDLEKWCSDDCARRALYLRVQLAESPAWERDGDSRFRIELLGESQGGERDALAEQVEKLKLAERERELKATNLAVERGEKRSKVPATGLSFDIPIREKPSSGSAVAPIPEPPGREVRPEDVHRVVEGYVVKRSGQQPDEESDDDP